MAVWHLGTFKMDVQIVRTSNIAQLSQLIIPQYEGREGLQEGLIQVTRRTSYAFHIIKAILNPGLPGEL
jgi:hypothetical protein